MGSTKKISTKAEKSSPLWCFLWYNNCEKHPTAKGLNHKNEYLSRLRRTLLYSFTIICLRSFLRSGSFAGSSCGTVLLLKRNTMNGCSIFLPPRTIVASPSLNASGADNDSSPRHHIFICGIGGCFFAPCRELYALLSQKRNRRIRRRFSRGSATTNAIVLMTLPTALQGAVITAASGYIISTGALRGAGVPPAPPIKFSEKIHIKTNHKLRDRSLKPHFLHQQALFCY